MLSWPDPGSAAIHSLTIASSLACSPETPKCAHVFAKNPRNRRKKEKNHEVDRDPARSVLQVGAS